MLIGGVLLFPGHVMATDQRCFTEEQCRAASAYWQAEQEQPLNNFITDTPEVIEACDGGNIYTSEGLKKLGFCLPSQQARTAISFGGRSDFASIADFIRYIYRYSVGAIAILAVVMIIFSGLQWAASGGNTETISRAKKRLAGAVTGLIIAVGSYTILITISPDLVNISPPQPYMINTFSIAPTYCHELEDTKVALALDKSQINGQNNSPADPLTAFQNPNNVFDSTDAECGSLYYIEGAGSNTCTGSKCPEENNTCYKKPDQEVAQCFTGNLVGTIYNNDLGTNFMVNSDNAYIEMGGVIVGEGWTWTDSDGWVNWTDSDGFDIDFDVFGICNDGYIGNPVFARRGMFNDVDVDKKRQFYQVIYDNEKIRNAPDYCEKRGGFKGFALRIMPDELGSEDDEWHFIGRKGKDLGAYGYYNLENGVPIQPYYQLWYQYTQMCQWNGNHFFTVDDLLRGQALNIDLGNVHDVDSVDEFVARYPSMGEACKERARKYFPEDLDTVVDSLAKAHETVVSTALDIISASVEYSPGYQIIRSIIE